MSPRTGRPKIENPKSEQIKIRATKEDKALLEKCCEESNKTQYDIVMTGINPGMVNELLREMLK